MNITLQQKLVIDSKTVITEFSFDAFGQIVKKAGHNSLFCACSYNILAYPSSEYRIYAADKYTLTCTRFTRKHIQLIIKGYRRLFNHSKIFNR